MAVLSYGEAIAVLGHARTFGIHPSLEGVTALCDALGRPQDTFSAVQVAGTNGKTSTARMVHRLLIAHGYRSALYTSPELERVNERIEVGTLPVDDESFARGIAAAVDAAETLRPGAQGTAMGFTEFELTTAAALWLFREAAVDVAVLEVGLGGRWDATSVVAPAVCVVTGVGLDHCAILGETIEQITAEKAAIIRPECAPVLGPGTTGMEPIFLERAEAAGTNPRAVRAFGAATPVSEARTVRYRVLERPDSPGGATRLEVRGICGAYSPPRRVSFAAWSSQKLTAICV
jgi:dihydrofolate synthase/folylpolyglutamate synthase